MAEEEKRFNIILGDRDPIEVEGRAEAVKHAKELSSANQNLNVSLERLDGMVSMQFREGKLEVFVTETRDKTKSRPRRERNDDRGRGNEGNNKGAAADEP